MSTRLLNKQTMELNNEIDQLTLFKDWISNRERKLNKLDALLTKYRGDSSSSNYRPSTVRLGRELDRDLHVLSKLKLSCLLIISLT